MSHDLVMVQIVGRAFALFAACLLLQVMVWRFLPRGNQGIHMVLIFFLLPAIACAIPLEITWALTCLLHLSMAVCYLILYTGVTGFSPSIAILERVDRSMPKGLPRQELSPKWFTDAHLSGARRDNLVASGLIAETAGVLRLTGRGRFIALCFLIFRRFLGLPDIAQG